MKKKIALAFAAIGFGLSFNVTAYPGTICETVWYNYNLYCVVDYNAERCPFYQEIYEENGCGD